MEIHVFDHSGIEFHGSRLLTLRLGVQTLPRGRDANIVVNTGGLWDDSEFLSPIDAVCAEHIVPIVITPHSPVTPVRRCLKGPVWCCER